MELAHPQLPDPTRLLPSEKKASFQRNLHASHIYCFSNRTRIHRCWYLFSGQLYCFHTNDGKCSRYDCTASIEKVYFGKHQQSFVLAMLHNPSLALRNSILLLPDEGEKSTGQS